LHRLQLHNRAPDPQPHLPALHVAAVEHEVGEAPGLDDGIVPVALDQEIGCPVIARRERINPTTPAEGL